MRLVVSILSRLDGVGKKVGYDVPFCFDEKKPRWVAANDSIEIPEEATIGVHAEFDEGQQRMHVTFIHGSDRLADFISDFSGTQLMMFRFSDRYSVSASIKK